MTSDRRLGPAIVALVTMIGCAAGGCADVSRGPAAQATDAGAGEGGAPSSDAALSFAADVHGILVGSCQRCHAAGAEAGDTAFLLTGDAATDLTATAPFLDVNAPAQSRLITKMAGQGHSGGTLFAAGTPEYQTVLRWIQEGARP
jgi:hypothetical protein